MGEDHVTTDRNVELDFLKAYKEKYAKTGPAPIAAIEIDRKFLPPAETYFKSKRTPQDEETMWMAVAKIVNPQITSEQAKRTADNYFMQKGPGEELHGLFMDATKAYDLGYRVSFVDNRFSKESTDLAKMGGGLEARNQIMGNGIASLVKANPGSGLVVIDGAAHNSNQGGGASVVDVLAQQGIPLQAFNLTMNDYPGQIPVGSSKEIMDALAKKEALSQPFQHASQIQGANGPTPTLAQTKVR